MNTSLFLSALSHAHGLRDDLLDALVVLAPVMTDAQRAELAGMFPPPTKKWREGVSLMLGKAQALLRAVRREERRIKETT